MVHQVLQRFGFRYSSPQSTPLPTSHSLSAPPSDESVEPSVPYPELVGCLIHRPKHWEAAKRVLRYLCSTSGMGLVLGGRGPVVLTRHADASWVDDLATQRPSQGYTFSPGSSSVSWRSTRSSSVLSSSCEAEIYAGAMAAQELRWLTYLLIDLGERPRSSPVLGAPLFLVCPLLPLLLVSTLLAPSRSALRLLLVRGAASARASGARELEEVVGAAVVAVEAEEGVGVGMVVEVGASVAAVEVEAVVAVAGGVEEAEAAAAEVELAEAELCSGDLSSSSALVRPLHPSSFVSGTQGARGLE
ncbi:unnamed protein product, partial [Closterium sp. NIES-54]